MITPPEEVIGSKKTNYIILWLLNYNDHCQWKDFKDYVNSDSTLAVNLKKLQEEELIEKILINKDNYYKITSEGKKQFEILKVRFPPDIILEQKIYEHIILWMLYNNDSCRWRDFLNEKVKFKQSTLSNYLKSLRKKDFIKQEEKLYKITQEGKIEYSKIIKFYETDELLKDEFKKILEVYKKHYEFFKEFKITGNDEIYQYLTYALSFDFEKVKTLYKEEDFNKFILFLSLNNPKFYPKYISPESFSKKYKIDLENLTFLLKRIVDENFYDPIKVYTIEIQEKIYYYLVKEIFEKTLRAIGIYHAKANKFLQVTKTDKYISNKIKNAIIDDICNIFFNANENIKDDLKKFIEQNIKFLADISGINFE